MEKKVKNYTRLHLLGSFLLTKLLMTACHTEPPIYVSFDFFLGGRYIAITTA